MPALSVVVLTLNEAEAIDGLLDALAAQEAKDFEVIVVDAASKDGTVERVRARIPDFPVPLRLEAAAILLPIGAARNLGVRMARAPNVAFLSADALPHRDWTARALAGLEKHDMVFGRQVHAPARWSTAAAVRGLRYHFPETPVDEPLPYASNVAAAFRKEVLLDDPFDDDANAAEDLLLARRAAARGKSATYDPAMVVRHKDVARLRQEARKNVREGQGWGQHADELGVLHELLAWGGVLALTAVAPMRTRWRLAALATVLWAPAVRRGMRRRRAIPAAQLLRGMAASPPFDLLFLYHYIRGLRTPHEETNA